MRALLSAFTVLLATMPFAYAQDSLSPHTMASWTIVCDANATESEQYAAAEFQRLFKDLTGATLDIADANGDGAEAVFIGPDAVARSGGRGQIETSEEEQLRIRVAGNAVYIDGGRPRGTLYGVYEFFEELCGVRYLTFDHSYFPSDLDSIEIPFGDHDYTPPFAFRWSYYGETNRNHEFATRLRVNTVSTDGKLGGRTGYRLVSHNVAYLVPPARYGEEHPEYYALVDGQRKLDLHGGGPQLCMTNPDVLDIVVEAVRAEIEKSPDARNINVAHMDNVAYCTCENCAAVDAREESHAGATLAFVNAVAERIEETNPDVLVSTYAYQYTRKPPKNLRARHNVMIQLCSIECCDFHAIDDPTCSLNREFCADMAGWKPKADHIFIWHYNTNFRGYLLPFPNLRSIGDSVDYFYKNNGQGVFMQAAGNGYSTELSDLRNYVMARCLWKPGRDSWTESLEFCRLHYGAAADNIIAYLTDYHALVDEAGTHPTCFPTESALAIGPESARRIMAYFTEALAQPLSAAEKARVEKASLCAYRAALSAVEMNLIYADGVCKPDLGGLDPDLLTRYEELCAKFEVSMESELTPIAAYHAATRKLHEGVEAVKAENDVWRILVLPDSNAQLIEMTYKPTGRNVTYAARSLGRFRFEEWVRQGQGPGAENIVAFDAAASPNEIVLTHTTEDGSRFVRTIRLEGDVLRFAMEMTAGTDRAADFFVHPEYDAGTFSDEPAVVALYVKAPEWVQANKDWHEAISTDAQVEVIKNATGGGVFAFFNHEAGYGIEQRFEPAAFSSLAHFWSPSRRQVNLEMFPNIVDLKAGDTTGYTYEVRYLSAPPVP